MDIKVSNKLYKLRAAQPMPIGNGKFILQTFMAEEKEVTNYLYTNSLPDSEDMVGQGGEFISANFSRLQDKGGNTFSGKVESKQRYIDEV